MNYRFVYPPDIRWNFMYQRPHQLMTHFARLGHTAIFYGVDVKEVQEVEAGLWIYPPHADLPPFDGITILWCSYPPRVEEHAQRFTPDILVFDALDFPEGIFTSWQNGYEWAQQHADIIFATADKLMAYNKDYHPHLLPNACDFDHFHQADGDIPCRLRKGDKPVIGMYGALAPWLDEELLRYAIRNRPQYEFVLIGPSWGANTISGATYYGYKPYDELPYYVKGFDVAIIPFYVDGMIEGCDPVKFYEYLATGTPIVATDIPALRRFEGIVHLAHSKEEFVTMLDDAIQESGKAERIKVAKKNSWTARCKEALKVIKKEHSQ